MDNSSALNEHGLLQSFAHRRRCMETALRLADNMLGQVSSITETDDGTSCVLLWEDMTGVDGVAPNAADVNKTTSLGGTQSGIGGTEKCSGPPETILDQEMNEKLKRLREMRAVQRKAAEMQVKPAFELTEREADTLSPPSLFTSTSLAFSLETLAKSVAKVVTSTDAILVQLSLLDRTRNPSIFNDMHTLCVHSQHALRCYSAAMQHLKQYEVCLKALQDGTAEELSNMREQFLLRKEMLTAREQKQKLVDEHLQSMKLRLNAIDARCFMWSTVLLDIPLAPPLPLYSGNAVARISLSHERDAFTQQSPTHLQQLANIQRSSIGNLSQTCSNLRLHTPMSSKSMDNYASSSCTSDGLEGRVDAMEVKVAQFWTNPYVLKAQRCTERRRYLGRFVRNKTPTFGEFAAASVAALGMVAGVSLVGGVGILHSPPPSHRGSTWIPRAESPKLLAPHDVTGRTGAESRMTAMLRTLLHSVARMAVGIADTADKSYGSSTSRERSVGGVDTKSACSATVLLGEQPLADSGSDMGAEASGADEAIVQTMTLGQEEVDAVLKSCRSLLKFLDS